MKLRSKALLIIAGIWAIVCLALFIDSKLIIEKNFQHQEEKLALKDITRVRNALKNQMESLALYTTSWSQWDDAYSFMQTKSSAFIKSNFVPGTYTSSSINFFIFYDTKGKYFYGQAFDLNENKFQPVPHSLTQALDTHPDFILQTGNPPKRAGLFKIPEGVVIISSLPVTDSDGTKPSRGTLLMGYYLSEKHIANLSKTVELKTSFYSLPVREGAPITQNILNDLLSGTKIHLSNINNKLTQGFTLVNDIDKNPIGILQVNIPRLLYEEGVTAMNHFLLTMVLVGVVLLITLWYLLKKLVLDRILNIGEQVIYINTAGDFKKRIQLTGSDELTVMTNSINSMLELIEQTQDQMKYRISQRTKDLEKASKLNRNLFTEMGKHKSMEAKLKEDQKQLRKMAYYDTLTNLPNRHHFNELLTKSLAQANEQNKIAVIFVDCDKFKKINDTYGHEFGDKFLKEIAARLTKSIGNNDVAARLAGDEFILFLSNVSGMKMIDDAIENIFQNLTALVNIDGITLTPTFSMGVSVCPDDGAQFDELCHKADLAMYHAKKSEGNIYYYFGAITTRSETV